MCGVVGLSVPIFEDHCVRRYWGSALLIPHLALEARDSADVSLVVHSLFLGELIDRLWGLARPSPCDKS